MFGVSIQARSAPAAVEQIVQAEAAGVQAAWANMGAAGGVDMMPVFAAAAAKTERIFLGNAIVQTWSRHPVAFAQETMAIQELGPGRFRLGIGPTTAFFVERTYGREYTKPLTNLREYLYTIRTLLHEGSVDFTGVHVSSRARLSPHAPVPVMGSALRPKSYELCGELSDGAISWVSPLKYLSESRIAGARGGRGERRSRRAAAGRACADRRHDQSRGGAPDGARAACDVRPRPELPGDVRRRRVRRL